MTEFMEWLRIFIHNYPSLQYLIIFLITAVGGELALFTLAFFAAQGVLSLFPLIVFGFLGAFSPNVLWFLIGRTATVSRIVAHRYTNTTLSIVTEAVVRISKGNHLRALIVAKFLLGTPIILMLYVNKTALSFKKFLYCESISIFLSLIVIIPIGFISGLGFTYLAENLRHVYWGFGFVVLIIVVLFTVQIWFERRFTKKTE